MAHQTLLIILLIGAGIGWTLFFYSVYQTYMSRKREMNLIRDIRSDFEKIKEDVVKLK